MKLWHRMLLLRITMGERLEPSTAQDRREWGTVLAFFPLAVGVFVVGGMEFLNRAPIWAVVAALTAYVSAWFFLEHYVLRKLPVWTLVLCGLVFWPLLAYVVNRLGG